MMCQVRGWRQGRLLHPVGGPEERGRALPARLLPLPQGQRGQGHHPLPAGLATWCKERN